MLLTYDLNAVCNTAMDAINKAIDKAGGLTELARRLGCKPQVISNWRARGIPAERVLQVEQASGVDRHELRPDLYPREAA